MREEILLDRSNEHSVQGILRIIRKTPQMEILGIEGVRCPEPIGCDGGRRKGRGIMGDVQLRRNCESGVYEFGDCWVNCPLGQKASWPDRID